ncbi:MAG: glycosyltransferase family 9 protein [Georgfuchsia sp.]
MDKILVIRRDNIGDLVCTTPLLGALRTQLPSAHIAVLATRYNEAVLKGNPDIDALYSYTKAKHRHKGESLLSIYWCRLRMLLDLRRQNFDWILLPGGFQASALRLAKFIGGRRILVRGPEDEVAGSHEVEQSCHLLERMGLCFETPFARVVADATERGKIAARMADAWHSIPHRIVGLHISARKPSQRWPAERFADLAKRISLEEDCALILLWAPGPSNDPRHPGDDAKAKGVLSLCEGIPVLPLPTGRLEDLIAALSCCDSVVCGDGGAMHLAAGLGKPVVALFGQSGIERWRPWAVPQAVLQKPSMDVVDITVNEVFSAWKSLQCASSQFGPAPTSTSSGTAS